MKVSSVQNIPNMVSNKELHNLFAKNNFAKGENGAVSKILTFKDTFQLSRKTGHYAENASYLFERPFGKEQQEAFKGFLALGKSKEFIKKHFNKLFLMFCILGRNSQNFSDANKIYSDNKDYAELIQNVAQNPPKKASVFDAIRRYKGIDCGKINSRLRGTYNEPNSRIDKEIKDLSKYIKTQVIKEPVKLYRGEGFEILNQTKLPNGLKFEDALLDAQYDKNKLKELNEMFLDYDIVAEQPSFMSTTMSKSYGNDFGHSGFYWELTTAPNTKACYVEPLMIDSCMKDEQEVVLQKGSKIRIKGAEFDEKLMKWCIKGEVFN